MTIPPGRQTGKAFGFLGYRSMAQPTLVEHTGSTLVSNVDRSNRRAGPPPSSILA